MFTSQNSLGLQQLFCFYLITSTSLVTSLAKICLRVHVRSGYMLKNSVFGFVFGILGSKKPNFLKSK